MVAVAIVLLSNGGENYTVKARFQTASQLVKGDLVEVSGVKAGQVNDIKLTSDGQAEITMQIDDQFAPLREGTSATVRVNSLSGVANRYIDLQLGPAGRNNIAKNGLIDDTHTVTAVDLDQLFNVFTPKVRQSLSNFLRGSAAQYAGHGKQFNSGLLYLAPSLAASTRFFSELNYDTPTLRNFVRKSAKLVTDVAERRNDLAGLISNLSTATGAIARQKTALNEAVQRLPDFMRRANSTFVNLRHTLDDLKPLIDESKPVAKKLRPFVHQLRFFAEGARPTIHDLANLIKRTGANNDLIELTRTNVPVANVAIGKNGSGAFPQSVSALNQSAKEFSGARPYAPDLTGWMDDFSHTGYYDALGGTGRVATDVNLVTVLKGVLQPSEVLGMLPNDVRKAVGPNTPQLYQNDRCPGSMDRNFDKSNPYVGDATKCDKSMVIPGN